MDPDAVAEEWEVRKAFRIVCSACCWQLVVVVCCDRMEFLDYREIGCMHSPLSLGLPVNRSIADLTHLLTHPIIFRLPPQVCFK